MRKMVLVVMAVLLFVGVAGTAAAADTGRVRLMESGTKLPW